MAHLSLGRKATALPLYAITGHGAALPSGEVVLDTYASMTALLAARPPVARGERIQVAGAPFDAVVGIYEGRWTVAGTWNWEAV